MIPITRRSLLASLAASAAYPLAAESAEPQQLTPGARKHAIDSLMAYLHTTAPQLLRPAEGILKHPSIAPTLPGKEYSTSLWDWDTLWTTRGLFRFAALAGDHYLRNQIVEHAQGSLLNFLDYQAEDGRLPILLTTTSPDPLGTVIKGNATDRNQGKPVFAQLALLIADNLGNVEWLSPHFDKLLRFHDSWARTNLTPLGLFVWGNDVAIGDDNDPTTFGRPAFSSANILLNCLFYEDLRAAAQLAHKLQRPRDEERLSHQARDLGANILKYCWDPRDRFFYTVDVQCVDRRAELIPSVPRGMSMSWKGLPLRIQMFTGFLPMWCGLATPLQARQMVKTNYLRDDRFRANAGVRTLSSLESMYALDFSSNPSNWLGPVWILANYFVWKGLKDYGFHKEAASLADKTLHLLASDIATTGSMNEYYHPDTGAPLSHKGFMDWNLLVLEMI
jgi:putative isomerase